MVDKDLKPETLPMVKNSKLVKEDHLAVSTKVVKGSL